ncbi:DUF190 domain-containing protein [Streptomyces sp. NPDC058735]|uniref:DUF190 domain-containing protein n=1 Tax=unclassified Streptomyces TaxID=2593676 RepID=UPI0036AA1071
MNRPGLTKMTKIDVVVPHTNADAVRTLITRAGATGYTSISGVAGLGHHGQHHGPLLFNDRDTLDLIITVVPDDHADTLIPTITDLLQTTPGVMFVSDTYVSRPHYFRVT